MMIDNILIGGTYYISYTGGGKEENYIGNAVVLAKNPEYYPENTLQCCLENGEEGYFSPEDFINYVENNNQFLNISTVSLIAELARRKAAGEKIPLFD